jgi:hypothetical protein
MPYPEEIFAALIQRCPLEETQQLELNDTLSSPTVKEKLESGELDWKNLVLALPGSERFDVLSPIAVAVALQDKTRFESYRQLTSDYPAILTTWSLIKSDILHINRLSHKESGLKQSLTRSLYPKLITFYQANAPVLNTNPITQEEAFHLLRSLSKYVNTMLEPMELSARHYFTALFQQQKKEIVDIQFSEKTAGDQLGRTMTIVYTIGESPIHKIVYHIKTHQDGTSINRLAGGGRIIPRTNPPDLKELLVYKVLEHTHIGPKAHFLFPPFATEGGLFIATQNGAFSKTPGKEKTFLVFSKLREDAEEQLSKGSHQVRVEAQKGLTRLELFMRIFGLRDILSNSGNFGKVIVSDQEKWKIIDFRVSTEANYINPDIHEMFLTDDMSSYGPFFQYIKAIAIANRQDIVVEVMREFKEGITSTMHGAGRKMPLIPSLHKAFCEMICFARRYPRELGINMVEVLGDFSTLMPLEEATILSRFELLSLEQEADSLRLGDLGRYIKSVIKNYLIFFNNLKEDLALSTHSL